MTDAQEVLAPCPFCGSEAELERDSDHHGEWFNLGCSRHWGKQRDPSPENTCIAGRMFYTETDRSEADAIAAWNTRAIQPELDALRAELERVRAAIKWVNEVRPAKTRDGSARVEMTFEEFEAMRAALKGQSNE